jgi:drug/metabolite transporter (DMT)-like permease
VAYLLAIASAALYGAADFLGGIASRRASTIAIVVTSQGAGLLALLLILPLLPPSSPSTQDLVWGSTAGVAGGFGVALLYRALAVGRMAVVAPTTAVCAVIIPVVAGVLAGDRLAPLTAIGMGLAMVAIVLVSRQTVASGDGVGGPGLVPPGVWLALVSGVAIGLFFLALARSQPAAGMWPLVGARAASVVLFVVLALGSARSLRLAAPVVRIAAAAGVIDMCANALYLAASRGGPLSVIVTLSSLYPASTVLLARVVLGERLNAWQAAGVACALVAITLIVGSDSLPF